MRDEIHIRPAREADLPELGRLGALLVRQHNAFDGQRFMLPAVKLESRGAKAASPPQPVAGGSEPSEGSELEDGYAWFLGTQLEEPDVVILVAERAGRAIGYAYAGLEPLSWKELREAAGFVHDVVVEEAERGQGVGTRLVEAAATWLESRGAPRVLLWTAEKNGPAHRMFERIGFRRTMVEMTRETRR